MSLLKEKYGIGIIVCRMQVPYLTASHIALIKTVFDRHQRIIIFLGTTNKPMDEKNPFPFEFRKQMLMQTIKTLGSTGELTIVPLPDCEDNPLWVKFLDNMISSFLAHDEDAYLYGGRESFIPFYEKDNGKFECRELEPGDYDSGTELRQLVSKDQPKYSYDAACAILWAMRQLKNKNNEKL